MPLLYRFFSCVPGGHKFRTSSTHFYNVNTSNILKYVNMPTTTFSSSMSLSPNPCFVAPFLGVAFPVYTWKSQK